VAFQQKLKTSTQKYAKCRYKWFLTETGLYLFVASCRSKLSKEFLFWIFSNVLPSLRRGDRGLVKMIMDNADHREQKTTIMTTTTFTQAEMDIQTAAKIHSQMVEQHVQTVTQNTTSNIDVRSFSSQVTKSENKTFIVSELLQQRSVEIDFKFFTGSEETAEDDPEFCVYFIRLKDTSMVKIGKTGNLQARMATLQTWSPGELLLELQFLTKHHTKYERLLHEHFRNLGKHVRGEWFHIPEGENYFNVLSSIAI